MHPFEWWFGEESFQPEAWPEPLYGFAHDRNRLFAGFPESAVRWESWRAQQGSFDTRVSATFSALRECLLPSGEPALTHSGSGTYEFGVYSVKVQQLAPGTAQAYAMCSERRFAYYAQTTSSQGLSTFDVLSNVTETGTNVVVPSTLQMEAQGSVELALLCAGV